jgi:hypothetical protein
MKIKNKLIQNIIIVIATPFVAIYSIVIVIGALVKAIKNRKSKFPINSQSTSTKIERYVDIPGVIIDETKLPEHLHEIIPYAKIYCIPDDAQRTNFINSVSIEDLVEIDNVVWNKMKDIEEFCITNTDNKDLQDIVLVLGYLSEAAAEIHTDERLINRTANKAFKP